MNFLIAFILIPFITIITIPFFKVKGKSIVVISAVILNASISSYFAVQALMGQFFELILQGTYITGEIPIRLDALSGWFILIFNFIVITGGFYGIFYMNAYKEQRSNLSLHSIAFILLHTALLSLTVIQNSIVFLIAWEVMAFSAFIGVIFEHQKVITLKAGINYLIQSHICIIFLTLGFIWVAIRTGSFDFNSINAYASTHQGATAIMLYMCFFIGFAIKAGFVPFHTWLPHAHPAAPSHISGIMSGVLIKIGIFGILRFLLIIKTDYTTIGYFIITLSVVSGLYGVMLAIVQHNLKKLLAYHSIENIGIIGIGIGIGCIGIGENNLIIASLGFAGALLHTLNHALFKSLLFYTAGNVYQATHTLDIEKLGGLVKKMPQTAILFLIAAIAICGIPPFNGFISEFIIYNALYYWTQDAMLLSVLACIFSVLGLVLIGGLAMLCFTKAFGVVFLGSARHEFSDTIKEVSFFQLLPLYFIAFLIIFIGLMPNLFLSFLIRPISLYTNIGQVNFIPFQGKELEALQPISWAAWGLILFVVLILLLKKFILHKRQVSAELTWGCAYIVPSPKMQYTASSFVRSYSKLFKPFLLLPKKETVIEGIFPTKGHYESHPYDKIEKWLIDKPLKALKSFLRRFLFLQNGKLQFYILYGILYILLIIYIPLIYHKIMVFIDFLKQL